MILANNMQTCYLSSIFHIQWAQESKYGVHLSLPKNICNQPRYLVEMFILSVTQTKYTIWKMLKPGLSFFLLINSNAFFVKKRLKEEAQSNKSTLRTNLSEPFVKSSSIISWLSISITEAVVPCCHYQV